MSHSGSHDLGVDAARAMAIIGVVLVHTRIYENGRFGVQLFFLVSGYLLANLGGQSSSTFIVKRAFRLFPLFWFVFFVFYVDSLTSYSEILASFLLFQNISWVFPQLPGMWSISNEWLYSLFLPIIRKIKARSLCVILGIAWFSQVMGSFYVYRQDLGQSPFGIWINTLNPISNLTFLLLGFGLRKSYIPLLNNLKATAAIIFATQFSSVLTGHNFIFLWPITLWALFSFCLRHPPKRNLTIKLTKFFGQRTYGIFFIHFLVLDLLWQMDFFNEAYESFGFKNVLLFFSVMTISSIGASMSWWLIELPAIRLGKKVTSRELQHR